MLEENQIRTATGEHGGIGQGWHGHGAQPDRLGGLASFGGIGRACGLACGRM
jgi:hypothetical protein